MGLTGLSFLVPFILEIFPSIFRDPNSIIMPGQLLGEGCFSCRFGAEQYYFNEIRWFLFKLFLHAKYPKTAIMVNNKYWKEVKIRPLYQYRGIDIISPKIQ